MTTNDEHDGARRGRGSRAGFTLMEVLVTILIIGLMLASVTQILTSVRYTRDTIHNIQEVQLAGPAIMDRLERDLRGIFTINQPREMHLRVMNRVLLGEDADRIDFVTTTDGLEWNYEQDRPLRADYNEVGYCLRTSRADDRFLEMYRREDLGVDETPLAGGAFTFLHDRVKSFNIEVFAADGPEEEPVEEWGMDPTDEDTQGLPAALRITLTLELAPRILRERLTIARIDRQTVVMTRVIRLPEGLRLAQADIPRLLVPVPPTESDPTPGAGGGEAEPGGLGGDPSGGNDRGTTSTPAGRGQGGATRSPGEGGG